MCPKKDGIKLYRVLIYPYIDNEEDQKIIKKYKKEKGIHRLLISILATRLCFYKILKCENIDKNEPLNALDIINSYLVIELRKNSYFKNENFEKMKSLLCDKVKDKKDLDYLLGMLEETKELYKNKYNWIQRKIEKLFNITDHDIISNLARYMEKYIIKEVFNNAKEEFKHYVRDYYLNKFLSECEDFCKSFKRFDFNKICNTLDSIHRKYIDTFKRVGDKVLKSTLRELRLVTFVYGILIARSKFYEYVLSNHTNTEKQKVEIKF